VGWNGTHKPKCSKFRVLCLIVFYIIWQIVSNIVFDRQQAYGMRLAFQLAYQISMQLTGAIVNDENDSVLASRELLY
jgi:hypothetical protein